MVNLLSRSPSALLVEPNAPLWAQRMALRLPKVFAPITPNQPLKIWAVNKVDLPPPEDWPDCIVVVPDQACLAVSDGAAWLKVAFGGPV